MIIVMTREEINTPASKYPYVGVVAETVVIFTGPKKGYCIRSRFPNECFKESNDWAEDNFKPVAELILKSEG